MLSFLVLGVQSETLHIALYKYFFGVFADSS
jgi:hypothetical protein